VHFWPAEKQPLSSCSISVVDISRGVFHSRLKNISFLKVDPPQPSIPYLGLKLVPCSITSVGYGADPCFLAVRPQVTIIINPLLSTRPAVTQAVTPGIRPLGVWQSWW